ncbi:MAG: CPBP family intramembrane metalloprotease [Firmicutes bacterium]|jgi:membrane protease YdiL (CAAX protease family)|nr:CPBP family intramembrane metalloprotease [Bacillota bacterium]
MRLRIGSELAPGFALVGALLFLRIPLLVVTPLLFRPVPRWVGRAWVDGTHLITALLVWMERDRLHEHNMDLASVLVLAAWPIVLVVLPFTPAGHLLSATQPVPIAHVLIGAVLGVSLLLSRPRMRPKRAGEVAWLVAGVLASAILGVALGTLMRLQEPSRFTSLRGRAWTSVLACDLVSQFTSAATLEEPVFRGFLWGCLRKAGWRDSRIFLVQAGLFWLAHLYYFPRVPISFWIVVPVGGLLFGLVAWRSRSVAGSMAAHALFNAAAILFAHYRL